MYFNNMRETLKQKIVTFLIKHPKLEMIFDILDAIFQKLMLGYIVIVSILFLMCMISPIIKITIIVN